MLNASMSLYLSLCLLIAAQAAAAQTPNELVKGESVRIWSYRHRLVAQNAWVDGLIGSVLSLKVPAEAHLETDALYTTLAVDTAEVDTLEVQDHGLWWRANFAGRPFVAVDPRVRQPNALERVPLYTRVRVWSRINGISGATGALVNMRPDSIDVHFAPGRVAPPRALALSDVEKMRMRAHGWSWWKGARAFGTAGLIGGVVIAQAIAPCGHPDHPTSILEGPSCGVISDKTGSYGLAGAAVGAVTGVAFAHWTRHRWIEIALPGR
jgi:hypothetical protein